MAVCYPYRMTHQTMRQYIHADPKICFGKPVFRGTRIPVYIILDLLESGVSSQEIIGDDYYPQLSSKHVQAALHYASMLAQNQQSLTLARA